jgi:alkanesulfonate monooxygenase SsuD/methylene tetrahydromethanopterin reductase-like flavin-dependent oxidoreductase (luciferase family)
MQFGVHLPLAQFGAQAPWSPASLADYTAQAVDLGFTSIAVADHLAWNRPWIDGLIALASVITASAGASLITSVALPVIRHPAAFAKASAAIDILSQGRLVAGLGAGSSRRDYDLIGINFDERWSRFDDAIALLRSIWTKPDAAYTGRYYTVGANELAPPPHQTGGPPLWIGSWGSPAGLRRVARLGDG